MDYYHLTADIEDEEEELQEENTLENDIATTASVHRTCSEDDVNAENDEDDDPNWLIVPSITSRTASDNAISCVKQPLVDTREHEPKVKLRPKKASSRGNAGSRISARLSQLFWTSLPISAEAQEEAETEDSLPSYEAEAVLKKA